jgi:two-component system response regulator AtoC
MRQLVDTVGKILERDASLLILGESGVGKDYLAEAIHACSRAGEPYVHVECASIPEELFESELFGHEPGTFTDAQVRKPGRLELAGRGTVYFDEISSLSPAVQAKLLRAVEERRFSRLGGAAQLPLQARVISSSNAQLDSLLADGKLRPDLYYRINVVTLTIPPLRERREDVLPLARLFLKRAGRPFRGFDPAAERLLVSYPWPGNVRELRNAVERAALLEESDVITPAALPLSAPGTLVAAAARGSWTLDELESHYIREVLRLTRSNYSRSAEILGINRKTLLEKRKKYGID